MKAFEPVARPPATVVRRRRRRRQFDVGLQPRGGEEAHPGGPRRGRPAQLRPDDAGGNQPRPDGPDRRPAVHDRARRGRTTCCARASPPDRIHFVGNLMIDSLLDAVPRAKVPGRSASGRGRLRPGDAAPAHRTSTTVISCSTCSRCWAKLRSAFRSSGRCIRARPRTFERFGLKVPGDGDRDHRGARPGLPRNGGADAGGSPRADRFGRRAGRDDGPRGSLPDDACQYRASDHHRRRARTPWSEPIATCCWRPSTTSWRMAESGAGCPSIGMDAPQNASPPSRVVAALAGSWTGNAQPTTHRTAA